MEAPPGRAGRPALSSGAHEGYFPWAWPAVGVTANALQAMGGMGRGFPQASELPSSKDQMLLSGG